jgi:hypothetical protein
MPQEHTIDELFEALGMFSNEVKANFDKVFVRLDKIEATMVTMDYLDDVTVNLKTGFGLSLRREDYKLTTLVGLLKNKSVISEEDAQSINSVEPFPKGV